MPSDLSFRKSEMELRRKQEEELRRRQEEEDLKAAEALQVSFFFSVELFLLFFQNFVHRYSKVIIN